MSMNFPNIMEKAFNSLLIQNPERNTRDFSSLEFILENKKTMKTDYIPFQNPILNLNVGRVRMKCVETQGLPREKNKKREML